MVRTLGEICNSIHCTIWLLCIDLSLECTPQRYSNTNIPNLVNTRKGLQRYDDTILTVELSPDNKIFFVYIRFGSNLRYLELPCDLITIEVLYTVHLYLCVYCTLKYNYIICICLIGTCLKIFNLKPINVCKSVLLGWQYGITNVCTICTV